MKRFGFVGIQLIVSLLGVFVPLFALVLLAESLETIPSLAINLVSITTFFAGSCLTLLLTHLERVRADEESDKSTILILLSLLQECRSIVNTPFDSLDLRGSGNIGYIHWSQRRSLVTQSLITSSGDRKYSEQILLLAQKMGEFKPGIWMSHQQPPGLVIETNGLIDETFRIVDDVRKKLMSHS